MLGLPTLLQVDSVEIQGEISLGLSETPRLIGTASYQGPASSTSHISDGSSDSSGSVTK